MSYASTPKTGEPVIVSCHKEYAKTLDTVMANTIHQIITRNIPVVTKAFIAHFARRAIFCR